MRKLTQNRPSSDRAGWARRLNKVVGPRRVSAGAMTQPNTRQDKERRGEPDEHRRNEL
jgi:hypothetical protein